MDILRLSGLYRRKVRLFKNNPREDWIKWKPCAQAHPSFLASTYLPVASGAIPETSSPGTAQGRSRKGTSTSGANQGHQFPLVLALGGRWMGIKMALTLGY